MKKIFMVLFIILLVTPLFSQVTYLNNFSGRLPQIWYDNTKEHPHNIFANADTSTIKFGLTSNNWYMTFYSKVGHVYFNVAADGLVTADSINVDSLDARIAVIDTVNSDSIQARIAVIDSVNADSIQARIAVLDSINADSIQARIAMIDTVVSDSIHGRIAVLDSINADSLQGRIALIDTLVSDSINARIAVLDTVNADSMQARIALIDTTISDSIYSRIAVLDTINADSMQARIALIDSLIADSLNARIAVLDSINSDSIQARIALIDTVVSDSMDARIALIDTLVADSINSRIAVLDSVVSDSIDARIAVLDSVISDSINARIAVIDSIKADSVGTGQLTASDSTKLTTLNTSDNAVIGSTAAGKNLTVNATEGSDLVPALQAANWTVGSGWAAPAGTLNKNADGTGTAVPNPALSITAGVTYKVTITLSALSVGSCVYTLGGAAGSSLSAATTYIDYVIATTTGNLIFTPTNTSRFTISAVSVKALTAGTGMAYAYGGITTPKLYINNVDYIGVTPFGFILPSGKSIGYNATSKLTFYANEAFLYCSSTVWAFSGTNIYKLGGGGNMGGSTTPFIGVYSINSYLGLNGTTSGTQTFIASDNDQYTLGINTDDQAVISGAAGLVTSGFLIRSVTATITAVTPGAQLDGLLVSDINCVSVCANANDAVTLPSAAAGMEITVINNGANTLEIYPFTSDDLGAGVNTATTLIAGANITFVAYNAVNWEVK